MPLRTPTQALLDLPDFPFNAIVDAVERLHLTYSAAVWRLNEDGACVSGAMTIDLQERFGLLLWNEPFDGDLVALADKIVWGSLEELLPLAQKNDHDNGRSRENNTSIIASSVEYLIEREMGRRAASPS